MELSPAACPPRLEHGEALFRLIFEQASVGVCVFDLAGQVLRPNPACCRISGWSAEEMIGRSWRELTHPEDLEAEEALLRLLRGRALDTYTVRKRFLGPQGEPIHTEVTVCVLRDEAGRPLCYVSVVVDRREEQRTEALLAAELLRANRELEERVAERTAALARANERLREMATHDALTGLANRRQFDLTLETEVRRTRQENRWLSLLMLDIDFFKKFNDLYGHQAGDRCLQEVAGVLQATFRRGSDLPARYGGEEFVVILPDSDPERTWEMAERVRQAIVARAIPHQASEVAPCVTASLGCVSLQSGASGLEVTPTELVRRADAALYASKAAGRNRVTRYPPGHAMAP